MSRLWILCCILLLTGCASTPAERAARAQAEMEQTIAVYGPACEKLGYQRDSDQWRDCVLRLSAQNDYRYYRYPTTTTCFGYHGGFIDCTTY